MRLISERLRGLRVGAAPGLLAVVTALAVVLPAPGATAAHRADRVEAWGDNGSGQLGDGTFCTPEPCGRHTPVAVAGLTEADVRAISAQAGGLHSLALLRNGTVKAWGLNNFGQLGDGTTTPHPTPGTVAGLTGVVAVAAGSAHSLALLSNGTVKAWGNNDFGQLGDGTHGMERDTPVPVKGLTGVRAIAAGEGHSLALLFNGTVKAWGDNGGGQLGDGTHGAGTNEDEPVPVKGLTGVRAIAAGEQHSLALLSNGTVKAWGQNNHGQLGDGTHGAGTDKDEPVPVKGLTGVRAIAGGGFHSLALLSNRTVKAWGDDSSGQLGDGKPGPAPFEKDTPVPVKGLTGVRAIAGGADHSLALLSNGTVKAWGSNGNGELGDGTGGFLMERHTPVTVRTGLTGITTLTAGLAYSLAA